MHNLFALSLIFLATAAITFAYRMRKRPDRKTIIIALLIGLISLLISACQIPLHACYAGGTAAPAVFTAVSMFIIYAFSRPGKIKSVLLLLILMFGSALTHWSSNLVHEENCTGNLNHANRMNQIYDYRYDMIDDVLKLYPESEKLKATVFPAGWIEDVWQSTLHEPLLDRKGSFVLTKYRVNRFWHSWFSGIYGLNKTEYGYWCSGGTYAASISGLELKRRSALPQ